jgi:GR25 family glycosyltransferase involved in LPS biosynthesis
MLPEIKILSLPSSIKRRQFMDYKMSQLNISRYDYIDAINGHNLREYLLYKQFCKKNKIKLLTGEAGAYGCLMSYVSIFKQQKEPVLILEDDVYFHKNFHNIANKLVYNNFDLIYFGYNNYRLSEQQIFSIKNNNLSIPVESSRKYITCGTYAVWYSIKAIELLKTILNNISHEDIKPIDHIVWYAASQLNSIILNPALCISEIRDSNIRPARDTEVFYKRRGCLLEDYMHIKEYPRWMR